MTNAMCQKPVNWEAYNTYQEGKMKRYGLLFSINGAAFAVVTWKAEHHGEAFGPDISVANLAVVVAVAASLLTALMFVDIWLFGQMMRDVMTNYAAQTETTPDDKPGTEHNENGAAKNGLTYFGPHGKAVLTSIVVVLIGAWSVVLVPTGQWWLVAMPAMALTLSSIWIVLSRHTLVAAETSARRSSARPRS